MYNANYHKHPKKKNDMILFIFMGIIFLGLIVSGYFIFYDRVISIAYNSLPNTSSNNSISETTSNTTSVHNSSTLFENETDTQIITLYFPSKKEPILIRELRRVKSEKYLINQVETLLKELLNGPFSTQAYNPFPKEMQIRGIYFNEGVFYIDLSKELLEKGAYSIIDTYLAFYSIVNTITELDKKSKVKILIQGEEPIKLSYANGFVFIRNDDVISATN